MNRIHILVLAGVLLGAVEGRAAAVQEFPTNAPARVELLDQYNDPQALTFPGTRVILLAVADRGGSEQIAGWITALKTNFAGRVSVLGLANLSGVPGFLREKVRKQFRGDDTHPVMMDWSGAACRQFGYTPGVANILIIDHRGTIRARLTGLVNETGLRAARAALEASLSDKPNPPPEK